VLTLHLSQRLQSVLDELAGESTKIFLVFNFITGKLLDQVHSLLVEFTNALGVFILGDVLQVVFFVDALDVGLLRFVALEGEFAQPEHVGAEAFVAVVITAEVLEGSHHRIHGHRDLLPNRNLKQGHPASLVGIVKHDDRRVAFSDPK